MKLRNLLKSIFVIMLLFIITGCNEPSVVDIKLSEDNIKQDINDFNITDLNLTVAYDDNTINIVNVTNEMLSKEDLDKLNVVGKHDIKINYLDKVITLNINLTNYYKVTFILDDKVVDTQTVEHGMDAILPNESTTNKEGYTFIGWNHDGKNITEDTIIIAEYAPITYTVTFKIDDKIVDTQNVAYGNDAIMPNYEREGYTFNGWDSDGKYITQDTVIIGLHERKTYVVRFYLDGKYVDRQFVKYGENAVEPEIQDNYVVEWDKDFTNIKCDLEVNGIKSIKKCKIELTILDVSHSIYDVIVEYDYGYIFTEKDIYKLDELYGIHMDYYLFADNDNFLNEKLKEDHKLCIASKYHCKGLSDNKLDINTFRNEYGVFFDVCVAYNNCATSDEIINSGILGSKVNEFINVFSSYFINEHKDYFNIYMISDIDSNNNLINDRIIVQLALDYSKYVIIDSVEETHNSIIEKLEEKCKTTLPVAFLNAIEDVILYSAGIKFKFLENDIKYEFVLNGINYSVNNT